MFDGIGVGRIKTVPFSSDSAYDSDDDGRVKPGLPESQAEGQERTNQSQCQISGPPSTGFH